MIVVLYTNDLEPITVLNLAPWAINMLKRGDMIQMVPVEPVSPHYDPNAPIVATKLNTVRIKGHIIRLDRAETLILTTFDEDSACKLRTMFLPGQRRAVAAREEQAFTNGLVAALLGRL